MKEKAQYYIRNWSHYNRSLIQRGSITFWFSEESIKKWNAKPKNNKRGRPQIYSDDAIICALVLKVVFRLPLRALQGFLSSLIQIMHLDLLTPYYSQISRRAQKLGKKIEKISKKQPKALVFDSTGFKVYGEGEWKVRQHGLSKRRTWRKVHIGICPDSHQIILEAVTTNSVSDCKIFPNLIKKAPKSVKTTYQDGAYDTKECYQASLKHGSTPITPPQKNAVLNHNDPPAYEIRNNAISEIIGLGGGEEGRKLWKKLKNYHRRSLVETTMFRFKTLFGDKLKARDMGGQQAEVKAICLALNKMSSLGMPTGEWCFN